MKADDARSASRNTPAVGAILAALLLASCTTSGPVQLGSPAFTNANPGIAGIMAEAAAQAEAEAGAAVAQGDAADPTADAAPAEAASVTQEDGSTLPVEVAYVPAANPQAPAEPAASGGETAAAAQAPADATSGEQAEGAPSAAQTDVASAPAPERFGGEATQPAPQKKRGFFASLFASNQTQAAAKPAAAQTSASETAAAQNAAAAGAAPDTAAAEAPAEDDKPAAPEETAKVQAPDTASEPVEVASAEQATSASASPELAEESKKRGFLASFFAPSQATAPAPIAPKPLISENVRPKTASASAKPLVTLASVNASESFEEDGGLPGVRTDSLFEITRKSGADDTSDVDLYEDESAPVQVASAAGLARLAPNGLLKQRDSVDVACLKPTLVRMLKAVERHYGKRMIITSGYRSPQHNRRVRGARNSMHMYCAAVDAQIPGVSKWELARFVRSIPGRGGVGTYCHTNSVHIDVGPERDWNWRCRRKRG